MVHQEELENVVGEKDIWTSLIRLLWIISSKCTNEWTELLEFPWLLDCAGLVTN